ncbi:coiled-coil domain-containing protein 187 [Meles meles]|uniref:coiled-coil domain-containing protein 187 n=1 Tax=Meles meles TaxID=9662 RepID=UPI001E69E3D2|nr:coiled-coil domain-containing protein 187 [Meles meles]
MVAGFFRSPWKWGALVGSPDSPRARDEGRAGGGRPGCLELSEGEQTGIQASAGCVAPEAPWVLAEAGGDGDVPVAGVAAPHLWSAAGAKSHPQPFGPATLANLPAPLAPVPAAMGCDVAGQRARRCEHPPGSADMGRGRPSCALTKAGAVSPVRRAYSAGGGAGAEQANPRPETPSCKEPLPPFRNKEAPESRPVAKLWGPVPPRVLGIWRQGKLDRLWPLRAPSAGHTGGLRLYPCGQRPSGQYQGSWFLPSPEATRHCPSTHGDQVQSPSLGRRPIHTAFCPVPSWKESAPLQHLLRLDCGATHFPEASLEEEPAWMDSEVSVSPATSGRVSQAPPPPPGTWRHRCPCPVVSAPLAGVPWAFEPRPLPCALPADSWESGLCPPEAEDETMAALRWPGPSRQPGDLRGAPHMAWSDNVEQPGPRGKARSQPVWSEGEETKDGDSSVSSGRLSGSSGGHEPCTCPPGPWKERPPQVRGPRRQPRESSPRLELLRDGIRAQAQWQASCASLGPSAPSSASRLCRASKPDARRKAGRPKKAPPAPWETVGPGTSATGDARRRLPGCYQGPRPAGTARNPPSRCSSLSSPGLGALRVAPCRVEDKTIPGPGREPSGVPRRRASVPREKAKRPSSSCKREKTPRSPIPRRAAKNQGKIQDSELVGVYAWRKGPALVRALLGPAPALPRLRSKAPSRDQSPTADLGDSRKVGAAESSPVCPRMPSPASVHHDLPLSANTPHLASCDQPVTIQNALTILRDLRQQIQAGLQLARHHLPSGGLELGRSDLWLRDPAGRRPWGPWSTPDVRGSFSKSPQAGTKGRRSSLDSAGSFPTEHHWNTLAMRESDPQPAGAAQGWNPSFQRPGSLPEKLTSLPQRPWSALAGQASRTQLAGAAQGRNPSFQRPGGPPEKLTSLPQRPWSALAGQASRTQQAGVAQGRNPSFQRPGGPPESLTSLPQKPGSTSAGQTSRSQRTWATYADWETRTRTPRSPCGPWSRSASFPQGTSTLCTARASRPPPSRVEHSWLRPAGGAPGREEEGRVPPPCPKPRGALGHPYSAEALREFMRQKTQARRRQALEEKASAVRALELRNQRLQDVYRKQREAVLGKAVPMVSQTTPGIVTFFPHCAQSRGLEAPGSLGSPVLEWSKVTSGMVLGDQEAPGSFCLCLNRALNRSETLEMGGPRDGGNGAPMLTSSRSSPGPLKLQDLTTHPPRPGMCIYLDPEESECLGTPGPLHFRYKQARLQALEAMADVLKQRIDILTAKLHRPEIPGALGDPVPDPSTVPAAPVCSGALVTDGSRGGPWDWADQPARTLVSPTCFLDHRPLLWSPDWERRQSVSPRGHHSGDPQGAGVHPPKGFTEDGCLEPDNRLARNTASFQTLGPFIRSSPGVPAVLDATRGSLQLEDVPAARGAGLLTPWTVRGCGKGEPADRPWAGWSGGRGGPLGTPSTGMVSSQLPSGFRPDSPSRASQLGHAVVTDLLWGQPAFSRVTAQGSGPRSPCLPGDQGELARCGPSWNHEPAGSLQDVHSRSGKPGRSALEQENSLGDGFLSVPWPVTTTVIQEPPGEPKPWQRAHTSFSARCRQAQAQKTEGQRSGLLANIPWKSPSALKSLQGFGAAMGAALWGPPGILRLGPSLQLEVWETQKALDQLLFKYQLERLMEKHSPQARPDPALASASEQERPRVCRVLEPTASPSTETTSRRPQPARGRDAATPSQGPQEEQQSQEDKSTSVGPGQEVRANQAPCQRPLARLHPRVSPTHQWSLAGPCKANVAGDPGHFTLQMLELSLREEELRAQHQTALLRLREKALAERMRAELAWLEQQRGGLGGEGSAAEPAVLAERQKQVLSGLEREQVRARSAPGVGGRLAPTRSCHPPGWLASALHPCGQGPEGDEEGPSGAGMPPDSPCPAPHAHPVGLCAAGVWRLLLWLVQREIWRLQTAHRSSHAERKLLLQHQADILSLRTAVAQLQQALGARTALPQRSGPEVKPAPMEGPARGSLCPSTPRGPGGPSSPRPRRSSESPRAQHLPTGQEDGTHPEATSAADSHRLPPRPAWGEDMPVASGWPDAGGRLVESQIPVDPGDPPPNPCPLSSMEKTQSLTERRGQKLQGQRSLGGRSPCSPPEATVAEGSVSPAGSEPELDFASSPREEPHQMETWASAEQRMETCWQEDPRDPFCRPEATPQSAAPAAAPSSPHAGSPLGLGPESESGSAPRTCSGSPAASSLSGLSCCSLQEFQKASATLVQLSESSVSLSDWEAGDPTEADPGWSGELSPQDSRRVPRGREQVAWERLEGGSSGPQGGSPTDAGGPEPRGGLVPAGRLLPLPDAPSGRSGSELSEASSEVWDEEKLLGPGPGADPASGRASPAGGSSHLEGGRAPCSVPPPSLGLGEGQEASRTSGSLISGLNTERAKQASPEAAFPPLPATASGSSDSDLPLSSPSESLASEGVEFGEGRGSGALQASAGCPEKPGDADLSLSNHRKPQQAWSEPEVPVSLQAPPGDPGGLLARTSKGWAPGCGGRGDSPAPEEACPTLASGVLPEILSPVDDVLSYGSADLPSSSRRDTSLPPWPPTLPAELEGISLHSGDFPLPPEDATSPGGSPGSPGEDASIKTGELPSLSEEVLPEPLFPGPQESELCLRAGRQGGSLGGKWGESCSDGEAEAVGSLWSEPACCLGAPSCGGDGGAVGGLPRLPARPPTPSRVAFVAGEALPMLLAAGGTGQSGTGHGGDPDPALGADSHVPGGERAEVVDLVSSRLTRRILCDALAVLSELAQLAAR